MPSKKTTLTCPQCKRPLPEAADHFPFCSERCKLLDLGQWATEKYVIKGRPLTDDDTVHGTPSDSEDSGEH